MSISLSASMANVSSGAIYKDLTGSLSGITESATQLPESLKAELDAAAASTEAAMKAQQGMFNQTAAVANTYTEILKKKQLSEGKTPDPSFSCGLLDIFSKGKEFLNEMKTKITQGIEKLMGPINDLKSKFGSLYTELQDKIKAVTMAIGDAAKAVAQAALDAFKQVNQALSDGFKAIGDKISGFANELKSGVNDLIDKGKAALKTAIGEIKAFAASIKLSSPFGADCNKAAKEVAIDTSKLASMADISKVMGALPDASAIAGAATGAVAGAAGAVTGAVASAAGAVTGAVTTVTSAASSVAGAVDGIKAKAESVIASLPTLPTATDAASLATKYANAEVKAATKVAEAASQVAQQDVDPEITRLLAISRQA